MKTPAQFSDPQLRNLIRHNLPQAPASPWFTKKVLNRLPAPKKRIAARIEIWACALAAVATAVLGIHYAATTISGPVITLGQILGYCTYLAIFGALIANIALPVITNRARGNL